MLGKCKNYVGMDHSALFAKEPRYPLPDTLHMLQVGTVAAIAKLVPCCDGPPRYAMCM